MDNSEFEVLYEELVPELQAHISDLTTQNILLKIHVKKLTAALRSGSSTEPVELPEAKKVVRKQVD